MIRKVDGKIMKVNGKIPFMKLNTLVFEVDGTRFPEITNENLSFFSFTFHSPQTIEIDYGDGVIETFSTDINHVIGWGRNDLGTRHLYQDGNSGDRFIVINFEDLTQLKALAINYARIIGAFPESLYAADNLSSINTRALSLTSFPDRATDLKNVSQLILRSVFEFINPRIQEGIFSMPLTNLNLTGGYDLSDVISSNLYKINQLKDTLELLALERCNIKTLPESFRELSNLKDFRSSFNQYQEFPKQLESTTKLDWLIIGNNDYKVINTELIDFGNHHDLRQLSIRINNLDITDLDYKWRGLYSLKDFTAQFNDFINTNTRFDLFVDKFYDLCVNGGSITQDSGEFPEYPNRFRNIAWGHSSLRFTGAKVAPTGYVQGVSNGTPTTSGEKVYVLQNQYNHVITHGIPL